MPQTTGVTQLSCTTGTGRMATLMFHFWITLYAETYGAQSSYNDH